MKQEIRLLCFGLRRKAKPVDNKASEDNLAPLMEKTINNQNSPKIE